VYLIIGSVLILVGVGLTFAAQRAGLIFVVRSHEEGVRRAFVRRGVMELLYLTFCLGVLVIGLAMVLGGGS
jgi:hypothetical protein